jgi:hypothetical protein
MADLNDQHKHDDDLDAFEAELASFEPRAMSPELRRRIGDDLVAHRAQRLRMVPVLAGLAAAACIVIGFALWHGGRSTVAVNPPVLPSPPPERSVPPSSGATTPPTLIEYQRAIARSPEALDALLAWPAGRGRAAEGADGRDVATAFTRSTASILSTTTTSGDSL